MRALQALNLKTTRVALLVGTTLLATASVGFAGAANYPHGGDFNGDGQDDLAIGVFNEGLGNLHGAGAVNVLHGVFDFGLDSTDDQIWYQNVLDVEGTANFDERFGSAFAVGDFNGDGYDDLAIGVPGDRVGAAIGAGSVNVLYGGPTSLTTVGNQIWNEAFVGVLDAAEAGDAFGASLTACDFNGDGYFDLAVGVPGEDVGGAVNAGAVHVFYGSFGGLTSAGDEIWTQDSIDVLGLAETGDAFGFALTSGDYNGDFFCDLAVGVPFEDLGYVGEDASAAVSVGEGTGGGVAKVGPSGEPPPGTPPPPADDDPAPASETFVDAGAVNVLFGAWTGLHATHPQPNQFWNQNIFADPTSHQGANDVSDLAVAGDSDPGDHFGWALTTGDFNGDGYDDLAVGVPHEDLGTLQHELGLPDAGAVNVLLGFHEGLIMTDNQMWHQNVGRICERAEPEDYFGAALAAGDFDGDGFDDLAIGVPHELVRRTLGAGTVNVIYGTRVGLEETGNQCWHQGKTDIKQSPNRWDQFGFSLAVGDYDGNGREDLAIGVVNETVYSQVFSAGGVNVLYGGRFRGLRERGNQFWHQNSAGVKGLAERFDAFGYALGGR